jgi:hypothetical protein
MNDKPAAGWYASPTQQGFIQWWDGNAWTESVQPTPQAPPSTAPVSAAPPVPVAPPVSTSQKVVNATTAVGLAATGAALVADGAIGLGQQRKGLKGLAGYFIWGAVLFVLGFMGLIGGLFGSSSSGSSPIPGAILMGLVAILLFTIGTVKLLIRAGSIAGGLLLIREGAKRGSNISGSGTSAK